MLARLEQDRQAYQAKRLRAANSWLKNLEEDETKLNQLTEAPQKLEAANQLLKLIRKHRHSHEEFLETVQKQTLERIDVFCQKIQRETVESQIITLFRELDREQRKRLYNKLADELATTTEEFNG